MNVDQYSGSLTLHGLELAKGTKLEDLRVIKPGELRFPFISSGEFETYRLADSEAASHLVFKNGQLWQVRISLRLPEDAKGKFSEILERLRNALHEAELRRLIGATRLCCANGCVLEACFDQRSMASLIIATFPVAD